MQEVQMLIQLWKYALVVGVVFQVVWLIVRIRGTRRARQHRKLMKLTGVVADELTVCGGMGLVFAILGLPSLIPVGIIAILVLINPPEGRYDLPEEREVIVRL